MNTAIILPKEVSSERNDKPKCIICGGDLLIVGNSNAFLECSGSEEKPHPPYLVSLKFAHNLRISGDGRGEGKMQESGK